MEIILMTLSIPFEHMDDFTLISIIQESPFSLAVLGYQKTLKRNVFLKLLKPAINDRPHWLERFTQEAQVCAQLKNPHIVDVYLIGEYQGYTYMAMEYVQGVSLKNILLHEKRLTKEISFSILWQILSALEYVHQKGVVHRDIKPGNIMVDVSGVVRLTDFGLAYLGEDTSVTQSGTILGTPAYMCPEQILGKRILPQSDFFSLGSTLYEMVTGEKSFSGDSYSVCIHKILNETPPAPSTLLTDLPPGIDEFIFWLLEKKTSSRPAAVSDIRKKINKLSLNLHESAIQPEIGQLVQKYYTPPPELPIRLVEGLANKISSEKISNKNIFSSKRIFLLLIIVIGFMAIMIVIRGNGGERTEKADLLNYADSAIVSEVHKRISDSSRNDRQPFDSSEPKNRNSRNAAELSPVRINHQEKIYDQTTGRISLFPEKSVDQSKIPAVELSTADTGKSWLNLEIIPWGSVNLNGKTIDSLLYKKEIILSPGKHQIILSHPEFPPRLIDIETAPGQTLFVSYSFLEHSGYLYVEARPWAEVYIDGKYLDTTPFRRPIVLSAGEHLLELHHPSYAPLRQLVTVRVNDTLYIKKNLSE